MVSRPKTSKVVTPKPNHVLTLKALMMLLILIWDDGVNLKFQSYFSCGVEMILEIGLCNSWSMDNKLIWHYTTNGQWAFLCLFGISSDYGGNQ